MDANFPFIDFSTNGYTRRTRIFRTLRLKKHAEKSTPRVFSAVGGCFFPPGFRVALAARKVLLSVAWRACSPKRRTGKPLTSHGSAAEPRRVFLFVFFLLFRTTTKRRCVKMYEERGLKTLKHLAQGAAIAYFDTPSYIFSGYLIFPHVFLSSPQSPRA